jgi:hypothetical protein
VQLNLRHDLKRQVYILLYPVLMNTPDRMRAGEAPSRRWSAELSDEIMGQTMRGDVIESLSSCNLFVSRLSFLQFDMNGPQYPSFPSHPDPQCVATSFNVLEPHRSQAVSERRLSSHVIGQSRSLSMRSSNPARIYVYLSCKFVRDIELFPPSIQINHLVLQELQRMAVRILSSTQ